jgi:asparagine synthase (glutamine-hydrolysing)
MSGLAVIYGSGEHEAAERMLETIAHRGPAASGIRRCGAAVLAQNYAAPDLRPSQDGKDLPFSPDGRMRICYDGQMGNWADLAAEHDVADGAFREERVLLRLYESYGADMLRYLGDTIFAFVISDGERLFAARDLLGIKTLFYGRENGSLLFASELKSLRTVTDDIHEFPEGHFMEADGEVCRWGELSAPSDVMNADVPQFVSQVREIIERSVRSRVDFEHPTAALLSGGMDSSVIALLSSRLFREKYGQHNRLKTYAIGVGESQDIHNARIMAEHLGTDHEELIVDLKDVVEALPEVIYYLESFDPSLVRSSVSNYLISRYAREAGFDVLLSGEGGDEVFCGYTYLKDFSAEDLTARQLECLGYLHNNASLRLDRMNQCNSIRVVAPLISGELLDYALRIPPELKQKPHGNGKIEKWIFRKAFEADLPEAITWRGKQEFSQGSGSADVLPTYFEVAVDDQEFAAAKDANPRLRSKEESYYFRIFVAHFGEGRAAETVGQWVTL